MPADPVAELGAYLTGSEADALAALIADGQPVSLATRAIAAARRERAKQLLVEASLASTADQTVTVLRAVAGAKSAARPVEPMWTMPGNAANSGHLTGEFHRLVQAARQSVTCATYNFASTSAMWPVLKAASERPEVVVTVYLDAKAADPHAVKAQLPHAVVFQPAILLGGKRAVTHAKFVVIDHQVLLLTSANFSYSAENLNIELGLLVHDAALAESIEVMMISKHGTLYELVP
jgi:phosphatidylserine/phosphatidylglycerophosphate/cardiolipin synthase-like enzyme